MLVLLRYCHGFVVQLIDGALQVGDLSEALGVLAVELLVDARLLVQHLLKAVNVAL